jgi:hypothetical protein
MTFWSLSVLHPTALAPSRWAVAVFAILGCQGRTPAPAVREPVSAPSARAPTDTVLQLERTVCFGFCPTYVATVTASGRGHISGTHGAAGFERDITVDTTALAALLRRFDTEGYFQLDSAYTPGHPLCDLYATDNPGATLFARLGSQSRRVQHYHGCHGAKGATPDEPKAAPLTLLTSLEDAVDSLVGIAGVVDSLRGRGDR